MSFLKIQGCGSEIVLLFRIQKFQTFLKIAILEKNTSKKISHFCGNAPFRASRIEI
jgi:hypothetical protein